MSKQLFKRLDKTPAYKVVSDALEQAILQRHIMTGDALPTEENLATQFGVNRSTVREGLRHMEQIGFVRRQGKKLIVSRPSYDLVGDHMSKVLMLNDVTFEELWQVKMVLEPLSAQQAAINSSNELTNRMAE
ncbi:MAG: GntR family transcriptional regulator, partial [Sneathiella sp.]